MQTYTHTDSATGAAATAPPPPPKAARPPRRWPRRAAALLVIAAALAAGYALGRSGAGPGTATTDSPAPAPAAQRLYTCSMHPQVRLDRPGKCPICGMPLIPRESAARDTRTDAGTDERTTAALSLSDRALAMAAVETTPVARRELAHELRTVGKVQYNESSLATVTARVDGYAERLFVNFTGVQIKAGDHLAEVFSPDLHVAQRDLLLALRDGLHGLAEPAKARLRRWGLTDAQVDRLVKERQPTDRITLVSPISGTVIEKSIVENSAFKAGDPLYRVANLDTVWVYLDVYEYDLPRLRFGQPVDLTTEALPGRTVAGVVSFVQPLVNEETRTVRVPVHVDNKDRALKPGMFVSAVVRARLGADGAAAPTGVEGKFSCVMHPQVLRDQPGPCPVCEMPLERIPGAAADAADAPRTLPLAVPAAAVLDAGARRIAYVELSRGVFEPRGLVLGPRAGAWYPVLGGLAEGERVVTRGGFLIDSQFQISGRPSLFYPGGAAAPAAHQHGGAHTNHPDAPAPSPAPAPGAPQSPAAGTAAPQEPAPQDASAPGGGHRH